MPSNHRVQARRLLARVISRMSNRNRYAAVNEIQRALDKAAAEALTFARFEAVVCKVRRNPWHALDRALAARVTELRRAKERKAK